MKEYERCPGCVEARVEGDFWAAKNCHTCKGTGFRRVPSSFVCNKCGGPLCPAGTGNADIPHGLVEAVVSGGYDSHHLFDGTNYEFSVCEKCLREFFNACAIPPTLSFYLGGSEDTTYAHDRAGYERRLWREAGGDIEKLSQGLCNVTIECDQKATWRQFCSSSITERAMCNGHKKSVRFANSYEVPAEWVEGIPLKGEHTPAQKKALAWAWLRSAIVPGKITYFQYVSGCVATYVGREPHAQRNEEAAGGIWVPSAEPLPAWTATLQPFTFDDGTLLVGSHKEVRDLFRHHQPASPRIVAAPVLPKRDDDCDDCDDSV